MHTDITSPPADTGVWALAQVARHYRIAACPAGLGHEHGHGGQPLEGPQLQHAARALGLASHWYRGHGRLQRVPLPAIARDRAGQSFLLWRRTGGRTWVQGMGDPAPFPVSSRGLRSRCAGEVLLLRPDTQAAITTGGGFGWCWPVVSKYRGLLARVLLAGTCLLGFALVTPVFFQMVMDHVLVHNSLPTLAVVLVGLAAVMLFETVFSAARYGLFAHAVARIDAELKAGLFAHVLSVAPAFFSRHPVGEVASRLRELDTVRDFMTHHCLAVLLDGLFSVVFLAVMFAYSPALAGVVVVSLLLYGLIALGWGPALHRQAEQAQALHADNQACLVETLNAVHTLKSLAAEPWACAEWEQRLAHATRAQRRLALSSAFAQEAIALVGKGVTATTLWWGAQAVMDGALSLGSFIAFNLFAARVAQPALRLGQVWAQYQQARVALSRLGVILQAPAQQPRAAMVLPRLAGKLEADAVSYRYPGEGPWVLDQLSFTVRPGEVVGVVGASGCGKSTLAKLLLGFDTANRGTLRIDGHDLASVDIASLHRQVGVVMQQPVLFQGSVAANIAMGEPGADRARIEQAARLAGAHGFIERLPQGYDTLLAEAGSNLSGGQRQRVAIARALLPNPPVLIFDEATSALDNQAQAHIHAALPAICAGRTVIMIAHRLETLRGCDRLLVLAHGRLIEEGSPMELARRPGGHYAHLLRLQREVPA